jgi:hypothetical protein
MVVLPISPATDEDKGYMAFGVGMILRRGDLGWNSMLYWIGNAAPPAPENSASSVRNNFLSVEVVLCYPPRLI